MRNGNPAQAMIINTATGIVEKEVPIPTPITGTHGQFRHIRMTKAGTLLVPHLGEGKVVEYDLDGKVLWSVAAKSPWHAVRLKNGNTLIAGDWSRYAREVNPGAVRRMHKSHHVYECPFVCPLKCSSISSRVLPLVREGSKKVAVTK